MEHDQGLYYNVEQTGRSDQWSFHVFGDEDMPSVVTEIKTTGATTNYAMLVTDKVVTIDQFTQDVPGVGTPKFWGTQLVTTQKQVLFLEGNFTNDELHKWHAQKGAKIMNAKGEMWVIQSMDVIEELKTMVPCISVAKQIFESAQLKAGVFIQSKKEQDAMKSIFNSASSRPDMCSV